jgi:NAD(P)-dependent dehydrogenase (short-subunit alcohol dehydrogenase family)
VRARAQVRVETIAADLSRAEERERLHAEAGEVEVLVNNAGAIPGGRLRDIPIARWQQAWDLKVLGYVHLCGLFLPDMEARRAGVILNIIGMAGRAPRPGYICGGAGNAAPDRLHLGTRRRGAGQRRAGARHQPGRHPHFAHGNPGAGQREAEIRRRGTLGGDADRPALWAADRSVRDRRPVGFLASPRAAYVNGTVVDVDGGGMFRG